jgi:hypothetical protein
METAVCRGDAKKAAGGHVKLILNVPYPDHIFYSLIYGILAALSAARLIVHRWV